MKRSDLKEQFNFIKTLNDIEKASIYIFEKNFHNRKDEKLSPIIDDILSRVPPIKEEIVLFRGITTEFLEIYSQKLDKYTEKYFTFTSRAFLSIQKFTNVTCCGLVIGIPAGSILLPIEDLITFSKSSDFTVILPRNTKFTFFNEGLINGLKTINLIAQTPKMIETLPEREKFQESIKSFLQDEYKKTLYENLNKSYLYHMGIEKLLKEDIPLFGLPKIFEDIYKSFSEDDFCKIKAIRTLENFKDINYLSKKTGTENLTLYDLVSIVVSKFKCLNVNCEPSVIRFIFTDSTDLDSVEKTFESLIKNEDIEYFFNEGKRITVLF